MASTKYGKDGPRYAPGMTAQARRPVVRAPAPIEPPPLTPRQKVRDKRKAIETSMANVSRKIARAAPGSMARKALGAGASKYLTKAVGEYNNLQANATGGARRPASREAMARVAYTQEENAFKKRNRIK